MVGLLGAMMFESLTDSLGSIFDRLTGRGILSEKDVDIALEEVRRALLEADVSLSVVQDFINVVRPKAIGSDVTKSIKPGQQVVKIVDDALVEMLGEAAPISLSAKPPVAIMMVGLQGSGKTTSTAKIAKMLQSKQKQKVLLASLDTSRPAAMEQLRVLGEQIEGSSLPIVEGQSPEKIAKRAMDVGRKNGYDVVLLDTAGRGNADEALMSELAQIKKVAQPHEILLVADSLTGQTAVDLASQFHERVALTGIVLTRTEGDGRGGAALSMRHVTSVPVKFLGTGEGLDKLEIFDAKRVAGRILGMGDITGLVEKATETMDAKKAEKMAARMKKGQFDLDDMAAQLLQMRKMGGMSGVLGMLPGMGKLKKQANAQLDNMGMDDKYLLQQAAIVSSMTKKEKQTPKLLNASRKKRIAAGSGMQVQDVNKLLKMHRQMADMMKKMGKGGLKGMMSSLGLGGGGMGDMGGLGDLSSLGDMESGAMPDLDALKQGLGSELGDLSKLPSGLGFPPKKK